MQMMIREWPLLYLPLLKTLFRGGSLFIVLSEDRTNSFWFLTSVCHDFI